MDASALLFVASGGTTATLVAFSFAAGWTAARHRLADPAGDTVADLGERVRRLEAAADAPDPPARRMTSVTTGPAARRR